MRFFIKLQISLPFARAFKFLRLKYREWLHEIAGSFGMSIYIRTRLSVHVILKKRHYSATI